MIKNSTESNIALRLKQFDQWLNKHQDKIAKYFINSFLVCCITLWVYVSVIVLINKIGIISVL